MVELVWEFFFSFLIIDVPTFTSYCSYHWIRRKGKPAPREIAPIVVSNHVSFIEPIFYFYELFPTIVASESHDSLPLVGTIIRAMQVISCPFTVIDFNQHSICKTTCYNHFSCWYLCSVVTVSLIAICSQVIYVNRFSASSRKHAVSEIKVKSFC